MLKITGGLWRGRSIFAPPGEQTRPTQSKVREALFHSCQFEIAGSRVLDLFAGSGILGFEALSRGAVYAVFVEKSRPAWSVIEKNIGLIQVAEMTGLLKCPVESLAQNPPLGGPFHFVFADPPYDEGWEDRILEALPWNVLLTDQGKFYFEWRYQKAKFLPEKTTHLVKIREKKYGDTVLTTYQKASSSTGSVGNAGE